MNVLDDGGFTAYAPESTGALAGTAHRLALSDGAVLELVFDDDQSLQWRLELPGERAEERTGQYSAKRAGDEIYFVSVSCEQAPASTHSVVLDLVHARGFFVTSTVASEARAPRVEVEVRAAALGDSGHPDSPRPCGDLVGKRVQYVYGPGNAYEHIYLTESAYTWHCLAGAERGLADTEACAAYALAEDVYLFSWREKVVPCDGLVVINYREMRSTGRIFGLDTELDEYNCIALGGRARILNLTTHDLPFEVGTVDGNNT